eukprot:12403105-Karenia_brevis.AAC.1
MMSGFPKTFSSEGLKVRYLSVKSGLRNSQELCTGLSPFGRIRCHLSRFGTSPIMMMILSNMTMTMIMTMM